MFAFLDVGAANVELEDQLRSAIASVVSGGWYVLGSELARFEQAFADYVGSAHCIGVGCGLDALHLSLRAMSVGPGDEVVVPAHTFAATWLAVRHAGAVPVPVDADPFTYNLDLDRLEAALTPRTRAIVPVHLYGQAVDMDPLLALAGERGLAVLEDAAQAHGGAYRGRRIGRLGDAAAWSFYPSKNLGAVGDAGAVTTDDAGLADRLRALRNYGGSGKDDREVLGFNSRLDDIQAAVLRVKLDRLDAWNRRRRAVAATYLEELEGTSFCLPRVAPHAEPVWHQFVIRCERRDAVREALAADGVPTAVHYPVPPHRQLAFADLPRGPLPVAERLAREVLSLPIGPHLDERDVRTTVAALKAYDRSGG